MDIASYITSLEIGPFTQLALFLNYYSYSLLAVISLAMAPFLKNRGVFYSLAISMVAVLALSLLLKDAYAIPRPCNSAPSLEKLCPPETDYALPSGHTAFAFVFVGAALGTTFFPIYFVLAVIISLSRVYLGVHTFTDVGGGAVLGILTYLVVAEMVEARIRKRQGSHVAERKIRVRRGRK